jgi:tetratricopeptide (TPR) repeat protein
MLRNRVIPVLLSFFLCAGVFAQDLSNKDEYDMLRAHAFELFQANNFLAALPELQKLADQNPKDVGVLEALGFALVSKALLEADSEMRKQERITGRKYLLAAKALGDESEILNSLLESTPEDGSARTFSGNKEIEKLMQSAEAHFAKGELDQAKAGYLQVLLVDSNNYSATLFTGDVYFKQKKYGSASQWFQKATEIDPNTETAYRYWGDALTGMNKIELARQKFMESIVASPYTTATWQHLAEWLQMQSKQLNIPKIKPPNTNSGTGKNININIDPSTLASKDGRSAWMLYTMTRATWQNEQFKKSYPNAKEYRHTLKEEAAALEVVVASVKSDKTIKNLDPQLKALVQLKDLGFLEPYILFNHADQGIAQDYVEYRKAHRDLLYKYLDTVVVPAVKPTINADPE